MAITNATPGRLTAVDALMALDGVWRGVGEGRFPTIKPFAYREAATFTADLTRRLVRYTFEDYIIDADGRDVRASHLETGIIRLIDDARVELFSAQTGRTEVLTGTLSEQEGGVELALTGTAVSNDPRIASTRRVYRVGRGWLESEVWMELVGTPGEHLHTHASLARG